MKKRIVHLTLRGMIRPLSQNMRWYSVRFVCSHASFPAESGSWNTGRDWQILSEIAYNPGKQVTDCNEMQDDTWSIGLQGSLAMDWWQSMAFSKGLWDSVIAASQFSIKGASRIGIQCGVWGPLRMKEKTQLIRTTCGKPWPTHPARRRLRSCVIIAPSALSQCNYQLSPFYA